MWGIWRRRFILISMVYNFILLLLSNRALYWFTAVGSEIVFYSNKCYKLPDWLLPRFYCYFPPKPPYRCLNCKRVYRKLCANCKWVYSSEILGNVQLNCKRVYRAINPSADNNFLEFQEIGERQKGL